MPWTPEQVNPNLGRTYAHAPINEAVFDVRVRLPDSVNLSQLEDIGRELKETYPEMASNVITTNEVSIEPQHLRSDIQQERTGFIIKSANGLLVSQLRLDGFTFSRLRPYESWAAFSSEAFRIWNRYMEVLSPVVITRIALRYINQIDVPLRKNDQGIDLSKYLKTHLEISPQLPQAIEGFFLTTQIALQEPGPRLQLIQTGINPTKGTLGLILDIDVYWEEDIAGSDEGVNEMLLERFTQIRDCKNGVFEACITDETRKLFG